MSDTKFDAALDDDKGGRARLYEVQWQIWPIDGSIPLNNSAGVRVVRAYTAADAVTQVETERRARLADFLLPSSGRRLVITYLGPST